MATRTITTTTKRTQQKKKNTRKKPAKQRSRRRRQAGSRSKARIPRHPPMKPCTLEYMDALLDPWGSLTRDSMPCVPDLFALPSQKMVTRLRGQLTIGTAGMGFVILSPFCAAADVNALCYTNSSFTGTSVVASGTGVVAGADGQIPWIATNAPLVRMVAQGVRVRYTGTELNRGGMIIPMRASGAGDNLYGSTTTTILLRQDHEVKPCDGRWHGAVFIPAFPAAYDFGSGNWPIGTTSNIRLGVMCSGTAGNTYAYDVVRYWEVIPNDTDVGAPTYTPQGMSRSHSDLDGLGMVRDFVGELTASESGQEALRRGYDYLKKTMVTGAAEIIGGPMAGAAANLLQWR